MSRLNEIINSKMVPTDALIFYQSNIDGFYVEHRPIENGKMLAGSPLSIPTLANMLKAVERYSKETASVSLCGKIPKNLLYAKSDIDSYRLVWYRKPEKRMMFFNEQLEIPNGEMWVPGLVYSTNGYGLSVFAFKGNCPRNVLYHAPFFNVSESHVCLGSAKVDKPKDMDFQSWIGYWEKMFWQSEFVHILGGNPITGNLATLTKELIASGDRFPIDQLKRVKTTLKDLLK